MTTVASAANVIARIIIMPVLKSLSHLELLPTLIYNAVSSIQPDT